MSLCNQVFDLADDYNKQLLKEIVAAGNVPPHVKTAQVAMADTRETLGRESFALVLLTKEGGELRKFPINDAANTWLSCQYFEKTAFKLPVKAKKMAACMLKKACAVHKLDETPQVKALGVGAMGNLYNEVYDMQKTASAPVTFEPIVDDKSEHFFALGKNFAMPNSEFVKKASAYFTQYEREFVDAQSRHEFASNVLARAKELEVSVEEEKQLRKYASAEYGDILGIQLRMRADLLQSRPEMSAALEKIASHRDELTPKEFARVLFAFDKKASLTKHYDSYLADAFCSTFERRFEKRASGYAYEHDTNSNLNCTEKELEAAFEKKASKIKGYFGPTLADQLKKHGCSIFDSLPRDAKETISKIAKGEL